ncbi:hypothetical protein FRIGORI9N_420019 [Frigoribacterium sp. 9N]|nr:hypothetical protein FRIGORI9N_420019 [Frigoribacterium sp. 9N]
MESMGTNAKEAQTDRLALWTFGDTSNRDVTKHLLAASKEAAQHSLRLYSSEGAIELLTAAVTAGLALETLLKSVASNANPLLLLETTKNLDWGQFLSGIETSTSVNVKPESIFTIGAMQAWQAATALTGNTATKTDAQSVFDTRNAAAHMGVVDGKTVRLQQHKFILTASVFLEYVGMSTSEYFGSEAAELVQRVQDEDTDRARNAVLGKLAAAKKRWSAMRSTLSTAQRALILGQFEYRTDSREEDPFYNREERCPVCDSSGKVVLDTRYILREGYVDESGNDVYDSVIFESSFTCFVCQFRLNEEEIPLAAELDLASGQAPA